jgi:hypothetical protein
MNRDLLNLNNLDHDGVFATDPETGEMFVFIEGVPLEGLKMVINSDEDIAAIAIFNDDDGVRVRGFKAGKPPSGLH